MLNAEFLATTLNSARSSPNQPSNTCFATLALGSAYRLHAMLLAGDLAIRARGVPLLILTDKPLDFRPFGNVIAVKHRQRSMINCFHDKMHVIDRALRSYEACVYLDADCRVIDNVPTEFWRAVPPGLAGVHHMPLVRKLGNQAKTSQEALPPPYKPSYRLELWNKIAAVNSLDIREVGFVTEACFSVRKDNGKEDRFLRCWAELRMVMEGHGFSHGEGESIGFAAKTAGWSISDLPITDSWLFNDVLAKQRRKHGATLSELEIMLIEQRRSLDAARPAPSVWQTFGHRLARRARGRLASLRFHLRNSVKVC